MLLTSPADRLPVSLADTTAEINSDAVSVADRLPVSDVDTITAGAETSPADRLPVSVRDSVEEL
jgi:hypothetical protein